MNYLLSDYISRLATKDARLELIEFSDLNVLNMDQTLLVEEKQLDRLKEVDHRLNLIVLVENRNCEGFDSPHRILRVVYKYDVYPSVLAEIFQERHPITLFTSTLSAFCQNDSLETYSQCMRSDVCCILDQENSKRNAIIYQHILIPRQFLYTNILDYLDPPIEYVENTILEMASKKSIDVISMPLDSDVQAKLLTLCDVALLLMTPDCIPDINLLIERYPNILPVCTDKIDGYEWIGDGTDLYNRILQMRREVKKIEVFGSVRNQN